MFQLSSPVADGDLAETTQAVRGRPLEMVTARVVNVVGGAFFRLEVDSSQP